MLYNLVIFLTSDKLEFVEQNAIPIGVMVGRGLDPAVVGFYVTYRREQAPALRLPYKRALQAQIYLMLKILLNYIV